jgi:hypothetical protein
MRVSSPRVLGVSLVVCLVVAVTGGIAFALVAGKLLAHGIGTALFVVGIAVLGIGLLGATEPSEGWATRRRRDAEGPGRRSFAARVADEHPAVDGASSLALAVWGFAVGGTLICLAFLAFYLESR